MSQLRDELKEALRNAAMGDEAAIEALAAFQERIASQHQQPTGQQGQDQEHALAKQVDQEWSDRWRFSGKVAAMAKVYPVLDKNSDPEGYAYAAELDAKLRDKHPDWDEDKRLLTVAERTTDAMGDPEDRDYADAIATTVGKGRNVVSSRVDTNDGQAEARMRAAKAAERSDADELDAQIELDRHRAIGEMALERRARRVEAGKPEDPRRMRRMFSFPGLEEG
jgi:hypothetical protein